MIISAQGTEKYWRTAMERHASPPLLFQFQIMLPGYNAVAVLSLRMHAETLPRLADLIQIKIVYNALYHMIITSLFL